MIYVNHKKLYSLFIPLCKKHLSSLLFVLLMIFFYCNISALVTSCCCLLTCLSCLRLCIGWRYNWSTWCTWCISVCIRTGTSNVFSKFIFCILDIVISIIDHLFSVLVILNLILPIRFSHFFKAMPILRIPYNKQAKNDYHQKVEIHIEFSFSCILFQCNF